MAKYYGPSGRLVNWYRGRVAAKINVTRQMLEEWAEEGKWIAKEHIATRATDRVRRLEGRQGRIVSGDMRMDVISEVQELSNGNYRALFGWLDRDHKYYIYQEGGFIHWRSGQEVEGMYAIADAADAMNNQFRREWARRAKGA